VTTAPRPLFKHTKLGIHLTRGPPTEVELRFRPPTTYLTNVLKEGNTHDKDR